MYNKTNTNQKKNTFNVNFAQQTLDKITKISIIVISIKEKNEWKIRKTTFKYKNYEKKKNYDYSKEKVCTKPECHIYLSRSAARLRSSSGRPLPLLPSSGVFSPSMSPPSRPRCRRCPLVLDVAAVPSPSMSHHSCLYGKKKEKHTTHSGTHMGILYHSTIRAFAS